MNGTIILGLISVIFGICIFLAWFFAHKARHQERMLMIEKGMNPNEDLNKQDGLKSIMAKVGILIIGLSIGLAVIAILVQFDYLGKSTNAATMSILGICGGVALVVANRLSARK
jgi:Flp pilus assembly protein TadB